jgi:tetratricopeptide (TPR) repeat protein
MMNRTIGILSLILLVISCKGPEIVTSEEISKILTADQQREYNYALTEATKQKLFGNFRQAAALFQKCIEVNPRSDVAHFQLAGILLMAGELEQAKNLNQTAVEINPENYWYRIQLGQILLMGKETEKAITVYEDINKKWPEKIEIKYEIARLYSENGSYAKALRILEEIEEENGISEPVSLLKEQIYLYEGKPELAEQELLTLLELAPEEIRYLGILAELYTETGEKEKAIQVYKKMFEIEPEHGMAQLSMAEFYRLNDDPVNQFIYLEKALANKSLEIERKMGVIIDLMTQEEFYRKHQEEIYLLIKVLENQYPGDYRVRTIKADYLNQAERYEEALESYNEVLKEYKSNYYIWEQAIFIENILERPQAVYERCDEAMLYFDGRPLLYLFKGTAATQLGRGREAINILEKGVEYANNNIPLLVQFYSFLAEAWRTEEDYDRSDDYFEKAIEMDPENLIILNNYSYYLSLRSIKLDEAERMSKKTIIAEPENPTYLDTYGWILYKSGEYNKAAEILEKALENGGDSDPDILEHYGDVLNHLERNKEAATYWRKALDLGGDPEILKKKLGE